MINIGTSGWHYQHWKGPFYPKDLPEAKMLEYYSNYFSTAEINNSFYKLPETETLEQWRKSVPDKFVYSVKASRYITHLKKLKDTGEAVLSFLARIKILRPKLGPVLFQLPPRWHFNLERLQEFAMLLPAEYRYTFEFRDSSWFNDRASEALVAINAAFCIYDLEGEESSHTVTADFVYVRLHGPDGAYSGNYDNATLSRWASACLSWLKQGKEVYLYFDNDQAGYAVKNALELKALLEQPQ